MSTQLLTCQFTLYLENKTKQKQETFSKQQEDGGFEARMSYIMESLVFEIPKIFSKAILFLSLCCLFTLIHFVFHRYGCLYPMMDNIAVFIT